MAQRFAYRYPEWLAHARHADRAHGSDSKSRLMVRQLQAFDAVA